MSDTSDSRNERSINRFYPTLGEAHRNITSRSADASRQENYRPTGNNPDQVSPLSSDDGHEEMRPPSPSSVYNGQDSHHDRSSFIPQDSRRSYHRHNADPSLPAVAYDPNATPDTRPGHVAQHSRQSNYRSPYSDPYEQESPYAGSDDVPKDPETSQIHDYEGGNISDESMDRAAEDISWNADNTQYRFLQSHSERDLSRVLNETSRISNPVFELEPSQPSLDRANSIVDYRIRQDGRNSTSQRPNQFYNTAAIHSGMQIDRNAVRVPTSPPPGRNSSDIDDTGNGTGPTPWSQLSDEQFSRIPLDNLASVQALRNAQDNNHSPEDWETVDDEHRASRNMYRHSAIGRVINGSSIADYSDRLLPEDAHNLDEPVSEEQFGWWERPSRRMPPVPPRGSSRAIQGNASGYQQYQDSNQGYRSYGFQHAPTRGVSAQDARSALYSRQQLSSDQDGPSYELTDMQDGRENPMGRDHDEEDHPSFHWDRVHQEVRAYEAQLAAEREAAEPPQLGRPLSGFDHVKLPCGLISLKDAFLIQQERRESGLEDQSESGNYIAHHPMVNPRYSGRRIVESESRRTALNAGPDHYTPLSPSTGLMVQPVMPAEGRPSFQRQAIPTFYSPTAAIVRSANARTSAARFPATSLRGSSAYPVVNVRTSSARPSATSRPSAVVRPYGNFRSQYSADYASNYGTDNGRNPFLGPGEGQNEQGHDDYQIIDLQPPQPAHLGHGSHGGSYGAGAFSDSEADLWQGSSNPRQRNPSRPDNLTAATRRRLNGVYWALVVLNLPLPFLSAVARTGRFSEALAWATRGEVRHLRD